MLNLTSTPNLVQRYPDFKKQNLVDPPEHVQDNVATLLDFTQLTQFDIQEDLRARSLKLAEIVDTLGHSKVLIDCDPFFVNPLKEALEAKNIQVFSAIVTMESHEESETLSDGCVKASLSSKPGSIRFIRV